MWMALLRIPCTAQRVASCMTILAALSWGILLTHSSQVCGSVPTAAGGTTPGPGGDLSAGGRGTQSMLHRPATRARSDSATTAAGGCTLAPDAATPGPPAPANDCCHNSAGHTPVVRDPHRLKSVADERGEVLSLRSNEAFTDWRDENAHQNKNAGQDECGLPTNCSPSGLRVFVFSLPPRFNADLVRDSGSGPQPCGSFLFRAEMTMHALMLDASVNTEDPALADWFFVPLYLACAQVALYERGASLLGAAEMLNDTIAYLRTTYGHTFLRNRHRVLWPVTKTLGLSEVAWMLEPSVIQQFVRPGVFLTHFALTPRVSADYYDQYAHPRDIAVPYDLFRELLQYHLLCQNRRPYHDVCDRDVKFRAFVSTFIGTTWNHTAADISVFARTRSKVREALRTLPHTHKHAFEERSTETDGRWLRSQLDARLVLAPSGWAPQTTRFYEALLMARVPVVISDAWRRPFSAFLNYSTFSVTIEESGLHAGLVRLAAISIEELRQKERCTRRAYRVLSWDIGAPASGRCNAGSLLLAELQRTARRATPANTSQ